MYIIFLLEFNLYITTLTLLINSYVRIATVKYIRHLYFTNFVRHSLQSSKNKMQVTSCSRLSFLLVQLSRRSLWEDEQGR